MRLLLTALFLCNLFTINTVCAIDQEPYAALFRGYLTLPENTDKSVFAYRLCNITDRPQFIGMKSVVYPLLDFEALGPPPGPDNRLPLPDKDVEKALEMVLSSDHPERYKAYSSESSIRKLRDKPIVTLFRQSN